MPYDFTIQDEQDYISVKVSGERTPGNEEVDAIDVWSNVAAACKEKQINRILVISSVTGRLPARAAHGIAYDPEKFGWSRRFKLAGVDLHEPSRQDCLFGEDVAVSAGYKVRVFDNEQDAKVWLLEK